MKNFLKDFQAFINRGNVIDMAVGVIIGAAFSQIINSLIKDVLNPILGFLIGKQDFSSFYFVLTLPEGYKGDMTYAALTKAGATVVGYGAFLSNLFNFLLLALVIFFMIRLVSKMREKGEEFLKKGFNLKGEEETKPDPTPENILLLREIRDSLKKKK